MSTTKLSLYGITDEISALTDLIEMDQGEITEDHEDLMARIDALIQNKTDAFVGFIQCLEDDIILAENRKKEINRFIDARKNAIEKSGEYVKACMDKAGVKEFKGALCSIKERKPSKILVIQNDEKVPVEFTTVRTDVSIDKKGLKKAVKDGLAIPGIYLADGKRSISFKLKSVK